MRLIDFKGQQEIRDNIRVLIESSKGSVFPHTLLTGGAGLGKTSLARAIAIELGKRFFEVNTACTGSSSESKLKLLAALEDVQSGDIIFLDEIHSLSRGCQEILYTALESGYITYGGWLAQTKLPPFTVIGATTDIAGLTNAMQSRFAHILYLRDYSDSEIIEIISNQSDVDATTLAKYCRGNPRYARNYLDWVTRYCSVNTIPADNAGIEKAMRALGVSIYGLTSDDLRYLNLLKQKKVLGVRSISHMLGIEERTVKTKIEPYLMKLSLIFIQPQTGKRHINMAKCVELNL